MMGRQRPGARLRPMVTFSQRLLIPAQLSTARHALTRTTRLADRRLSGDMDTPATMALVP